MHKPNRRRDLLSLGLIFLLSGCTYTQQAIAPATVDDLLTGMAADVENWSMLLLLFVGV